MPCPSRHDRSGGGVDPHQMPFHFELQATAGTGQHLGMHMHVSARVAAVAPQLSACGIVGPMAERSMPTDYRTCRTPGSLSSIAATANEAIKATLPTSANLINGATAQCADSTASATTMGACTMKAP